MSRNNLLAAIDVGTDKICTIIASQSPDSQAIQVMGVATHESKGIRKSQIVDLEDTIRAITESVEAAERMAGFSISDAYISISGNHIKSQNSKGVVAVSQPEGEINQADIDRVIDAARALSLPASMEVIHVIPREYKVDSQAGIKDPTGMTGVRLESEVHVITGTSTAIRNITKCIAEVGINTTGLVFSGLASSISVLSETEKELGVVLVDIGAGTTSMCVYVEGALAHSSVIPIGARNITNDLAIGMRISLSSAEKIKLLLSEPILKTPMPEKISDKDIIRRRRLEDKIDLTKLDLKEEIEQASRKNLTEGIIRPRLNEIFKLINQELKNSNLTGLTPAGVVITGGGAETVQMIDACKRNLNMPARIGKPAGLNGLIDEIHSPAYAASTGMIKYAAMQGSSKPSRGRGPELSNFMTKIPSKGMSDKLIKFIKSLLP